MNRNPWPTICGALLPAALDCLGRGGTVITANARAARALHQRHANAQSAAGELAWLTPAIHDWGSWLQILWKQHLLNAGNAPLLLSPLQERAVWKRIAASQGGDSDVLAELAAEAWKLLSEFNAHAERKRPWNGTPDAERFRVWASGFERECRAKRWITRTELAALLAASIERGIVAAPAEILLVGFDRIPPSHESLIAATQRAGATISLLQAPESESCPRLVRALDLREELATCAAWASRILRDTPGASIGVIVQDIGEIHGEVERTFRRIIAPASMAIGSNAAVPFEFSLGAPLSTIPVIRAALLTLQWLSGPIEAAAVSWLMISGFLAADGEDAIDMATLDTEIRRAGKMHSKVQLALFTNYTHLHSQTARRFFHRLRGMERTAQAEGIAIWKKTFPEWMDFAARLLRQAHWPGARTAESIEFQALSSWETLESEISALGFDGRQASFGEFVTVLERYAGERIFATESRQAPIQIMGPLESSGQEFDATWFVGTDDSQWPSPGSPHPLLPPWLQSKCDMPHANVSTDWNLALAVTQRLASSPRCVFSYAQRNATGELRPSALLAKAVGRLESLAAEQLRAELNFADVRAPGRLTVDVEDEAANAWPHELHAGGAEVLKRQSACPFQSFAVRRLGAVELEAPARGLDPRNRGTTLHKVLETLWSAGNPAHLLLRNRTDLLNAKAEGRLDAMLGEQIALVFKEVDAAGNASGWSTAYLQVEQERLQSLLSRWLDYESSRQDFTVEECEKAVSAEIRGLKLKLRVDRIDAVAGGRAILDYKSSKVSSSLWEGDRPDEPQLPVYAIHGKVDDLRGVLFAQIRTGDMRFQGRVEEAATTLGALHSAADLDKSPLTQEVLDKWAESLSNLADDFLKGNAAVEPKSFPKTCKYCPLPSLCRIAEVRTAQTGTGDDPDEDTNGTHNEAAVD